MKIIKNIFRNISKYKKLIIFSFIGLVIIILALFFAFHWSQISWCINSSFFKKNVTYSNLKIMGSDFSNLDQSELNTKISELKLSLEKRELVLKNNSLSWKFSLNDLGVSLNLNQTAQKVLDLNNSNFIDKYKLLLNESDLTITPMIDIDNEKCTTTLSSISIEPVLAKNALAYYDNGVRISDSQSGSKYEANSNCQKIPNLVSSNIFENNIYLEEVKPEISKFDLEPKLSQIKDMVEGGLTLNATNYKFELSAKQLIDLLEITKNNSEVVVKWSSSKLDNLISSIASSVNTNSSAPRLNSCQYLINNGGYWLDSDATKAIFTNLSSKTRSYELPIAFHEASVGTYSKVAGGNSGTVYLTFDDGLAYGDQIMNYASCFGIKITFFEIGQLAGRDSTNLKRAINEGHAVQSHGYEHALFDYGQRSYDWQYNDIKTSIEVISSVTGIRPTYFRPPGGNRSDLTYQAAAANNIHLILWGVSSGDGANIGSATTCSNVLARVFDGATVLLHSSKSATANAVPCIIQGIAAKGYNMQALR